MSADRGAGLGPAPELPTEAELEAARPEIERVARALPDVREVALVVAPHPLAPGAGALAALVVGPGDGRATASELIARLAPRVVPRRVLALDALPRTPDGGVDLAALRARLAARAVSPSRASSPGPPAAAPRDTLELQLRAAFEAALAVSRVGPDEDLFALGGHAGSVAEVVAFAARHLGVAVAPDALARHPTPRALAAAIRALAPRAGMAPAALVRAGRPGERPLFVIGGKGVEVGALRELARGLAPVPVYGLQDAALRGEAPRLVTLVDLARDLLQGVLHVAPRGPYRLLGTSFGGRVAFELARLLRARGEDVELLALVDSYAPGYLRFRPSRDLAATLYAARCLVATSTRPGRDTSPGELVRLLAARARRELTLLSLRLGRALPSAPAARREVALAVATHAARVTRHASLDVRVDLVRSSDQPPPELASGARDLGWGGLATGGVAVHEVSGGHGDYLRAPVADEVARVVLACLSGPPA